MDTLWQSICDQQEAIEKEINNTDEDRRPTRLRPFQENLDPNKCSPGDFSEISYFILRVNLGSYIEEYLMPVVEEALIEMVKAAEGENVFKYKKRNKFNGCDFLTEYLFNKNPKRNSSKNVPLDQIPFCQDFNKKFPRKQLPLSLR